MKIIKINAVWCPACIVSNKIWKNVLIDYPNLDIEELDLDFDGDEVLEILDETIELQTHNS